MRTILQKLKRMDQFIQKKATGTPKQLASKLGISERTVFEYMCILKSFNAPVRYNRTLGSYYYEESGSFIIDFIKDNPDPQP